MRSTPERAIAAWVLSCPGSARLRLVWLQGSCQAQELAAPFTFFDDCSTGEPPLCNAPLWTSTSFHRGPTQAFHLVPNGELMMNTLAGSLRPATALFASKGASQWVLPVRD